MTASVKTLPIRVALVGLSTSAATSWASSAHLPNLRNPAGKSRFKIVALQNSSVSAAEAAIKAYKLDADTKAYGSPSDLASDPDVDFVIISTRVNKHYETALPSIEAGKDVYLEWPVASNQMQMDALVKASQKSGSRVLVGLQTREAPQVLKVKEILDKGIVGKLLSTEIRAFGGTTYRDSLPLGMKYFVEREAGGNIVTIAIGHAIDYIQSVVGNIDPSSESALFQLQRPDTNLRNSAQQVVETIRPDVPDLFSLHGVLPASSRTQESASLAFYFRRGDPFPSTPPFTWSLTGTDGEIHFVSPTGSFLSGDPTTDPVTIQVHRFDTDAVENVEWTWSAEQEEVPQEARNTQRVLYAYADEQAGVKREDDIRYVTLEEAVERASQIENWLQDGFKG